MNLAAICKNPQCRMTLTMSSISCIHSRGMCKNSLLFFSLGYDILAAWIPAIINHLYWAILTCNGNGKELAERFLSIIHHVFNRHKLSGNKFYHSCAHKPYDQSVVRMKLWMKMGSPPHEGLRKVIFQPQLVKDLEKMNKKIYTTYLEVFHSVKIRYLSKSVFYNMEKMIAGTQLAALDHNHNVNREQVSAHFFHICTNSSHNGS